MSDLAQELAALVADTLAAAESWRATGAFLASTGPLEGLPAAEPWPAGQPYRPPPQPSVARVEPHRPVVGAPSGAPLRPAPPPIVVARPPLSVAPRPAPPAIEASKRPDAPAPRPSAEPAPAGGGPGLAGLFGAKWQKVLRNPNDEIAQLLAAAPPCPACGAEAVSLRGAGNAEARLAVVAAGPLGERLAGESGVMFDRMLMHVLALERADVWVLEANACAVAGAAGTCRGQLLRQLEVGAPKLLLAMGDPAAAMVGVRSGGRGAWTRWGAADVLATFHPAELLTRQGEKRAAMEHLTSVRQRL